MGDEPPALHVESVTPFLSDQYDRNGGRRLIDRKENSVPAEQAQLALCY
jgi:hypothetical protein